MPGPSTADPETCSYTACHANLSFVAALEPDAGTAARIAVDANGADREEWKPRASNGLGWLFVKLRRAVVLVCGEGRLQAVGEGRYTCPQARASFQRRDVCTKEVICRARRQQTNDWACRISGEQRLLRV
ncbi:hypothetical protein MRX96_004781 [Rhipicephalus microplus]